MTDPRTDRRVLTERAYASDGPLAARQSIYAFAQPPGNFLDWVLDHAEWTHVRRVVDVGCGNGAYLAGVRARADASVVGFDLSVGMARAAAGRGMTVAVADAQAIPLPHGVADIVLSMHMLYHVPDMSLAVGELRRVLRPGGVALIATNGEGHQRQVRELIADAAGLDGPLPTGGADRFGLDRGAELLREAFDEVVVDESPRTLVVPDVEPVAEYVESMRALSEGVLPDGIAWDDIVDRVRARVAEEIAVSGAFRVSTRAGVFVCR